MKRLALPLLAAIALGACETPMDVPSGEPDSSPLNLDLVADPALAGHWKLDEGSGTVAADASANGNFGTLMNGPTWVPGHSGSALSLDGVNDYVLVPDDPALNMVGDFTISVWVKWSGSNADADILRKGSAETSVAHYKIELKNNRLRARLVGTRRSTFLTDIQTGRGDGSWHHVAVVRGGTASRLYIDGVLIDSSSTNVGDMSNSANLAFGAKDTGDSDFFRGSIDDIRFYSRALTSQEIGDLMGPGDDTPPTVPENVAAAPLSPFSIRVTWDESSDPESVVSHYKVYRDDVFVGQSVGPLFDDEGLTPETTYLYEVSAVNGDGLESTRGGPAEATTPHDDGGDDTPPTVPQNVAASPLNPFSIRVTWDESSDPESGVSHYKVYRDDVFVGQSVAPVFDDEGLTPETTYLYEVSAVNGDGLESSRGGPAEATTPPDVDTTPPTAPQGVAAAPLNPFSIRVTWDESSDPESGVSHYKVYRDDVFVGQSVAPVFDDEGLTPETTYLYEVSAVNGDGLESTRGGPAGATTPPDDSGPGDGDIVGHWRFDEGSGTVAADASGNGNLGTLMNGPIWVPGYSGTALSFDGIDDYVLVPDDDALNMVADFTISVWVKWSGANADADILRKGSAGTSVAHYKIELKDNRLKVRLVGIQRSTVLSDNQTGRGDGVWHNVVVTREGTVSRLYIDGALIASSNTNVGDMSNSANLAFGAKDTGTSDFFRGSIDDIRFYSRALSAQEIGNLGAMPMLVRGSN